MKRLIFLLVLVPFILFAQTGKSVLTQKQITAIDSMIQAGAIINVKSYGAVGDSLTDDTQAFQDAIDANDKIFVPEGVYTIDSVLLKSNTQLFGEGNASKLCLKTGGNVLINIDITE